MINIIIRQPFDKLIDKDRLEYVAQTVLAETGQPQKGDISLILTDDKEIQQLNKTFRGIDQPTDVLSFNNEYLDLDTGIPYLGEIIISYPTAETQATQLGNLVSHELEFLLIHGCLHLLGYDHTNEPDRKTMWQLQRRFLEILLNPIMDFQDYSL
ncbi:MAG: rRNA maturation RNase YbeY [Chloroflexota bacterium]